MTQHLTVKLTQTFKNRLPLAFAVGFGTMGIDFIFHATSTSPNEVPAYFLAKFLLAALVAYFAFGVANILLSAFLGAILFDILTGIYYSIAGMLHNYALSCCFTVPPEVHGIPYQVYFTTGGAYGYAVSSWTVAFIIIHFAAFFLSFAFVASITKPKGN